MDRHSLPMAEDLEERVPVATPHVDDENERFISVVNRNGYFGLIKAKWRSKYRFRVTGMEFTCNGF